MQTSYRHITYSGVCAAASLLLALSSLAGDAGFTDGKFALGENETIVFTGGTNTVNMQWHPYFETILTSRFADKKPRFRNMAWEADTVYAQPRELNFPDWPTQLKNVNATVIFAQFGQMECLGGREKLPAFVDAYNKLLDVFSAQTKKIVLVSPTPFESLGPGKPNLSARNDDLKLYVDAIKDIAHARGLLFADLSKSKPDSSPGARLTSNGVHLTQYGQWQAALVLARELNVVMPEINIELDARSGKSSVTGTTIAGATINKSNIAFQSTFSILPMPRFTRDFPAITQGGLRLKVSGLSNDETYVLKIDGANTSRLSGSGLKKGLVLNLGDRDKATDIYALIQTKNTDWFNYWRPANWAFLHGDRQHVASSFDHRDPKVRWFPTEMEQFLKLIAASEEKIFNLAQPATYRFEVQPE